MSAANVAEQFVDGAVRKLAQDAGQIRRCVGLLNAEQCWQRANSHCNSVGNLVLHLTGNLRQWILGGVAGHAVLRNRSAEFETRGPLPATEFLPPFERVIAETLTVVAGLSAAQLAEPREIQGYRTTVLIAVLHVVEHVSFHTGQIVHITKTILDVDLSLYDEGGQRRSLQGFP